MDYKWELYGITATPNCTEEYLDLIYDISVDYDGCNTVESLKELIDEMVDLTKKAKQCLKQGKIKVDKEADLKSWRLAEKQSKQFDKQMENLYAEYPKYTNDIVENILKNFDDIDNVELGDKNKFNLEDNV